MQTKTNRHHELPIYYVDCSDGRHSINIITRSLDLLLRMLLQLLPAMNNVIHFARLSPISMVQSHVGNDEKITNCEYFCTISWKANRTKTMSFFCYFDSLGVYTLMFRYKRFNGFYLCPCVTTLHSTVYNLLTINVVFCHGNKYC